MKKSALRYFSAILSLIVLLICSVNFSFGDWIYPSTTNVPDVASDSFDSSTQEPVAYKKSGNTNTYYPTVEGALKNSQSGDTVYVYAGKNPTIKNDATVPSGVTLLISFDTTTAFYTKQDTNGTSNFSGTCTSMVTIDNATLTVNGTLAIVGKITGGSTGASSNSGATHTQWASVTLSNAGKIIVNGNLNCTGYILKGTNSSSSYVQMNNGSKVQLPFIVRDFRGGSATYAVVKNNGKNSHFFFFDRFEMRNIQTKFIAKYGSTVTGIVNCYMSMVVNTTITIVGNTSSALVQLTDSTYSSLECEYNASSELMDIIIYGGAKNNGMSVTISGNTANSNNSFLPLSYHQKVTLKRTAEQKTNNIVASFDLPYYYKILPGGYVKVDEGTSVTINNLFIHTTTSAIATYAAQYPAKNAAKLIVNGTLNATNIGGPIYTETSNAVLNISNSVALSSLELAGVSGSTTSTKCTYWLKFREPLKLKMSNGATTFTEGLGSAYSSKKADGASEGYWEQTSAKGNCYVDVNVLHPTSESANGNNGEAVQYSITVNGVKETLYTDDRRIVTNKGVTAKLQNNSNVTSATFNNSSYTLGNEVTVNNNSTFNITPTGGSGGSSGVCLLADTKIMLEDGTYKYSKDLNAGDIVLTFNHESGKYEPTPIAFTVPVDGEFEVITLEFDDGTIMKVATGHGLYNFERNKYEIYYSDEFAAHIGEHFAKVEQTDSGFETRPIELVSVNIEVEKTTKYSPVSYHNINLIADNMLSIPDDIEGMFDIFTFKADMTIDMEAFGELINEYGLFTYDELSPYMPEFVFNAVNFSVLKPAVKMGVLTSEKINKWLSTYLPYVVEENGLDWDIENQQYVPENWAEII